MKWKSWLEEWDMTSLKIKTPFLEMDFSPSDADKSAAWELYIELLTRVTTQSLRTSHGDEQTALDSIYSIFGITRDVIKKYGRNSMEFTKIAIIVLNQVVRPFTSKWHTKMLGSGFDDECSRNEFRQELEELRLTLVKYSRLLADMADVEDLSELEIE